MAPLKIIIVGFSHTLSMQYMESLKKIDIEQHDTFPCNNANNECWLCEREIAMSCFSDVVANLVEVDSSNMKKENHSIQKMVNAELCDVHKKRYAEHHWSFENNDHILR